MQTTLFKWDGGEREVTRDQILEGMERFDHDYRGKVPDTGHLWFVKENAKQYPPKWVLSLATGIPRNEFHGGDQTNKVLLALKFELMQIDDEIADSPQVEEAIKTTFGIERDLQSALRSQIAQLEPGLKITDGGKEKIVASGRIDITAEDVKGAAVVIELKAGEADRDAIGQILGYMGDMSLDNKAVRGILVAGGFAPRAIAAARVVPNLRLEKYSFNFVFTPVS
jgi:Endonuclease NucS